MIAEIEDYLNGMSWADLQSKYHCNSHKIYKLLEENNIPRRKPLSKYRWSDDKLKLLKDMYLKNCTYKEMYNALNCKGGTLTYWVKQLNLPMRGRGRNNILINPFLEDSKERDYWLGYLFADGHIGQNSIRLCSKEIDVVSAFNDFCKNQCKIYTRPYITKTGENRVIYHCTLISKDLQKWFSETYGVEGNKKYTLNPTVKLNWDILLGYFDGDGSAHKKGGWGVVSGSKIWIYRIYTFLENNGISSIINEYPTYYKLYVWKKKELCKLVPLLYNNFNSFYLKYKFNRLEPYIGNNIVKTE